MELAKRIRVSALVGVPSGLGCEFYAAEVFSGCRMDLQFDSWRRFC